MIVIIILRKVSMLIFIITPQKALEGGTKNLMATELLPELRVVM